MTQKDNRATPPSGKIDFRVFYLREKSGLEIITIGYFEDSNGCIKCICWLDPNLEHFFYTDLISQGLINLGKKHKFVECRLASKSEEEFLFLKMKLLGFRWSDYGKTIDEDLSLVRTERRFNIITDDDDMFFDSDIPRLVKPQPMAIFWRNESV